MAKRKKSRDYSYKKAGKSSQGQQLVDRSLVGVSPYKEQFEPTDGSPIRQHQKMGGTA